jgi:hypothetical protein
LIKTISLQLMIVKTRQYHAKDCGNEVINRPADRHKAEEQDTPTHTSADSVSQLRQKQRGLLDPLGRGIRRSRGPHTQTHSVLTGPFVSLPMEMCYMPHCPPSHCCQACILQPYSMSYRQCLMKISSLQNRSFT